MKIKLLLIISPVHTCIEKILLRFHCDKGQNLQNCLSEASAVSVTARSDNAMFESEVAATNYQKLHSKPTV